MKRFISAMLAALLVLAVGLAAAEGMDFASMSDGELQALVDGARNELAKRQLVAAEDTVLIDQDGVTVYLTGEHESYGTFAALNAVIVNDSEKSVSVMVDNASINGWDVSVLGIGETTSGKKQKGTFSFNLEDADISSFEEIEELEMNLYLYDSEEYERICDNIPVTLTFGN